MKILLSVDAIFHPLTGIGRYTWELAEGLAKLAEPPELKYFAHGRLVGRPVVAAPGGGAGKASLAGLLRQRLAAIKPVVQLYSAVMPVVNAWRLKPYADHLFHASNYFIPPFGGRSVATVHDLSTLLFPQFHPAARVAYMNTELPRTLARAAHLITPSEYIRGEVIEHLNWPADKVTATHLGVDPRFQPHSAEQLAPVLGTYGLAPGGYSLCVATLEPRKNIERLVNAYAALPPALQRQYPLVLAGSAGWNSEDLHRKIRQGQNSGLRYLDYVPQEHLYALYAGARLFAYPSLYEGFGLPVLEAMASGVPVLTSRNSSLTEVAGNAAWLVDALDVDGITQGIAQTLQDEGWRSQAITAGLAQARALTWDACVRKTHQVYQKVGGLP